jgi:hypothetical protein
MTFDNNTSDISARIKAAIDHANGTRILVQLQTIKFAQHFPNDQTLAKKAREAQAEILRLDAAINTKKICVAQRPTFYVSKVGLVTTSLEELNR